MSDLLHYSFATGAKNFTLFAAAPMLSNGWALLGDLTKLVPCSPQRFVAHSTLDFPLDKDLTLTAAGSGDTTGQVAVSEARFAYTNFY